MAKELKPSEKARITKLSKKTNIQLIQIILNKDKAENKLKSINTSLLKRSFDIAQELNDKKNILYRSELKIKELKEQKEVLAERITHLDDYNKLLVNKSEALTHIAENYKKSFKIYRTSTILLSIILTAVSILYFL